MTDLKPCPFCGNVARIVENYEIGGAYGSMAIVCNHCDIKVDGLIYDKCRREIELIWNTRAKE